MTTMVKIQPLCFFTSFTYHSTSKKSAFDLTPAHQMSKMVFLILALSCFSSLRFAESIVPQDEVDTLQQITRTMGAKFWSFNSSSCNVDLVGVTEVPPTGSKGSVECECNLVNNTCHVVGILLKGYSLPGVLPPELVKLPYLREIDFAYNYLSGSIPSEWASMQLSSISLLVNRLSGEIPKELGDMTSLTFLSFESNQFSGVIPSSLGKLNNLKNLLLSSNQFSGPLPTTFARLTNLTDFRINDNNFNGTIPDYIGNWKDLDRLEMYASGLEGPIPSTVSSLNKLTELRISDIKGPSQGFPDVSNMTGMLRLVLRNCNLSGEIPAYIWTLNARFLQMLDVSFNELVGEIPTVISLESIKYVFLSGNMLHGNVPDSILKEGCTIDLSYNNFTWQDPEKPACRKHMNLNINMFRSSPTEKNLSGFFPCVKSFVCPRYSYCSHVNCGGSDVTIKENDMNILYEGDGDVEGGDAKYYTSSGSHWGFSSTGDFMDDNNYQNTRFTRTIQSPNTSQLYATARLSPISLTYFHYCLENGNYTVKLHFAEIQFTNDRTFSSLGRRLFDIYVQERLIWKDFNIEDEAHGVQKPVIKELSNVSVTDSSLQIQLFWTGKGTTRIPVRGVYGPLISAISVTSNLRHCSTGGKKSTIFIVYIFVGVGVGLCIFIVLLGILWWKGCLQRSEKNDKGLDLKGLDWPPGSSFTLRQIKISTNDFDPANKIGEGGFGPVYKGILSDGTLIAVKQLSSKSRQGNREFLNEMGMISCLQHPNLVTLYGCCVEKDQLLLIYEYMENNSLARSLFDNKGPELNWPIRLKICIGIAKGLAFLHEESRLKIVHRDIKATNVLLDKDLNPKISDFGLAKLDDEGKTHITTRVAGTIGYMAPEYALWGHLTYKADVYSFGVLALEIVSGYNNNDFLPTGNFVCLLDWACHLHEKGELTELVDKRLGSNLDKDETMKMAKVALLCTNASASLRPTMSEVVNMLEGRVDVPDVIPEPSTFAEDLRFKAMRDLRGHMKTSSSNGSHTGSTYVYTEAGSSFTSGPDSSKSTLVPKS